MKTMGRMVLAAAGMMLALAMGAGCASPGKYWYETRYMDVRPSGRTLENGPFQLSCRGHSLWVLEDSDPGLYLTDEMREKVAEWMPMPKEEVDFAHLAWFVHRQAVASFGHSYDCSVNLPGLLGKSYASSAPFANIQRQLFNWITENKEALYRGEHRKKLRFAFFCVRRDLDAEREAGLPGPRDIEYWVCIFDKDDLPIKTSSTRAMNAARVAALRTPGMSGGKQSAEVRIGGETVAMWNPKWHEEADQLVIGGLLVEALNAMDESDFARLDYED